MQAVHGNVSASIAKASALLAAGPPGHLDLLVLPELAFAGYVWDHADELAPVAEAADGPTFRWASAAAKARGAHVLVGFAERDAADDKRLHNAAMVVGPDGALVTVARKTALTDTDALWAERGSGANSMPVVDVPGVGRIGVGICKDMSVVPVGAVAGEHHMDNSFRAAEVDVIALLSSWDSSDAREVIHEKWKARVSRHLGTPTVHVVADQTGAELGVPYAGASTVMDLAGPTTLGSSTTRSSSWSSRCRRRRGRRRARQRPNLRTQSTRALALYAHSQYLVRSSCRRKGPTTTPCRRRPSAGPTRRQPGCLT